MALERRPIGTERLVLEPIEPRHTAGIFSAAMSSVEHLLPWMPWVVGLTEERISGFNDDAVIAWAEGRSYAFAMADGGRPIGVASLDVNHGGVGEVGYWIEAAHAGRGLATEAARALLDLGFGVLSLYRVELRAGVDNSRSVRVAEKLGFTREGILRHGLDGSEGPFDAYMFGMTKEDWAAGRG